MAKEAEIGTPGTPLAAVLAGGAGSRLGGAKPTAELRGRPLISYPLAALAAAGIEAIVVAKRDTELPPLDCPLLFEPDEPRHPLCGIVAALREAAPRPLLAVACDMPLLDPSLLAHLAASTEPLLVPGLDGRLHPLLARYTSPLLPHLEAALERQEPLRHTVASLAPAILSERELTRFGNPHRFLLNVNTPSELRHAATLLPT